LRQTRATELVRPATLRAAWWAFWAARRAEQQLRGGGIEAVHLSPPPSLPASAEMGVSAALRVRREACLVRAAVRQRWLAAHDSPRDIVIGVQGPTASLRAHAWLEGDPPCHSEGFEELLRRPAAR
jgi:hypothetical protein